MTTLKLEITIEYNEDAMHGSDPEAREWFFSSILQPGDLFLHSNEIGDVVGEIKQVSILGGSSQDAAMEIERLTNVLSEIANASRFDNIGNWARNKAKAALANGAYQPRGDKTNE